MSVWLQIGLIDWLIDYQVMSDICCNTKGAQTCFIVSIKLYRSWVIQLSQLFLLSWSQTHTSRWFPLDSSSSTSFCIIFLNCLELQPGTPRQKKHPLWWGHHFRSCCRQRSRRTVQSKTEWLSAYAVTCPAGVRVIVQMHTHIGARGFINARWLARAQTHTHTTVPTQHSWIQLVSFGCAHHRRFQSSAVWMRHILGKLLFVVFKHVGFSVCNTGGGIDWLCTHL